MIGARRQKAMRLWAVSLTIVLASIGATSLSSASPSKQDVADAKQRLDSLNGELSVVVEQFNLARIRLVQAEQHLEETREEAARARARADDALAVLNDRAGRVYQGFQSQWSTLLEASSIADFSDRIEFMGHLAQADADLATTASNEQREALWLADELEKTVEERRSILQDIERKQAEIRSLIDQAQKTYEQLGRKYRDALAAERAAAAAAAETQAGSDITTGVTPGPVPVVSGSVDAVIAAARSVIGVPYIFGAADPAVGFDCSGLTMWAWAHAGVSLPHSSSLQYASLPPIDSSALQPGDLVFSSYGRLGSGVIDHVALYIGAGQTIAASSPSSPVGYRAIDWDAVVGAARPG
jgi:cell wall-associated NlpC family hydrolase